MKSILHVEGKSFNFLFVDYEIQRKNDHSGYPIGNARLLGVRTSIEASAENFWWEMNVNIRTIPKMVIEFQPTVLGQHKTKFVRSYECHITRHRTSFSHTNSNPTAGEFFITAQGMEMSDSVGVYST
jgi:hypothetical protein